MLQLATRELAASLSTGHELCSVHQLIDLGWGSDVSGEVNCKLSFAPAPLPPIARLCWCGAEATSPRVWRAARVAMLGPASGTGDRVLRVACGEKVLMQFPLARVTALRRVNDDPQLPGIDITVVRRTILQLRAASSGMDAQRLQLLHTYVAAALEGRTQDPHPGSEVFMPVRCDPLEWPQAGGRSESLVQLAAGMRGVRVCKPHEVEALGRFTGSMCPICLETWAELQPSRDVIKLPCGHAFCERCLGESTVRSAETCPSCRRRFGPQERPWRSGRP